MEINRNNYEEYFLLYADNELSDGEKIQVLQFIRDNKDLDREFRAIQDTICQPDGNIVLGEKLTLYSIADEHFITIGNCHEIFVLYHDDELSTDEKEKVELFLSEHPEMMKDFEMTGMAKLEPDYSVKFPDVTTLYPGKESGRTIPMFWRSLAAAVVIGFGVWIFQQYYQQESSLPVAVTPATVIEKSKPLDAESILQQPTPASGPAININRENNLSKSVSPRQEKVAKQLPSKKVDNAHTTTVATTIKNREVNDENIAVIDRLDTEIALSVDEELMNTMRETPGESGSDISKKETLLVKNDNTVLPSNTSFASDVNAGNENYVFYNVTTEEFRKSKVGGFLKKVRRIVERNNPVSRLFSGDDGQIVAN